MKILLNSDLWCLAIVAVVSYLIGCFNFAVLISHIKKKDIRSEGSGNPGTMNMTRTFGLKIGAINFFCDVIKGGLPAVIVWIIFKDYCFEGTSVAVSDFMRYFCGVFVIIGHIFPVTMKFKGGKGIASTMGLFAFAIPCEPNGWWYFFIAVAILVGVLLYIIFTEWGSMGSLIGVSGLTIFQMILFILRYSGNLLNAWVISTFMVLLLINFLTWFAHRKNIYKLVAGEEHHTSVRKHKKKA
ncbi:MAG: glycerol-3-phosphate acyltransferase [Clostridiales bacterium]|nr:glycerol-3-phosphate acyltransferase [Clostridiales bacterium]